MEDHLLYTPEKKRLLRQLCRYQTPGIRKYTKQQWLDLLINFADLRHGYDFFFANGQLRMIVHRFTGKSVKVWQILNDVIFLHDGRRIISENTFIVETLKTNDQQGTNRFIYM